MTTSTPDSGKLEKALDKGISLFIVFASKAMANSLEAIEGAISPYPPQPDRMRSGHLNTYVRGQGQYPKSSFVADQREPGGFKTIKTARARIRFTSQRLDDKFRTTITTSTREILGILKNTASYSGYVIGSKQEAPKQVAFHAETGWQNKEDAFEIAKPIVMANVEAAVDEMLQAMKGG